MPGKVDWQGFVFFELTSEVEKLIFDCEPRFIAELADWVDSMVAEGYTFSVGPTKDGLGFTSGLYGGQAGHKHAGMKLTGEADTIALACAAVYVKFLQLDGAWHSQTQGKTKRRFR